MRWKARRLAFFDLLADHLPTPPRSSSGSSDSTQCGGLRKPSSRSPSETEFVWKSSMPCFMDCMVDLPFQFAEDVLAPIFRSSNLGFSKPSRMLRITRRSSVRTSPSALH